MRIFFSPSLRLALAASVAGLTTVVSGQTTPPPPSNPTRSVAGAAADEGAQISTRIVRAQIEGIDVIAYPTGVKDVVTFRGSLPAGDSFAPEQNFAIPTLVGGMLDKGTTQQDKFQIAQQLESVGASLSFSVDGTMLNVTGKCLEKDLPLVVTLLAEQLRSPAFSEEEFGKLKRQLVGSFRRQLEDTNFRATEAFLRTVYPVGHPNYNPPVEQFLQAVESAQLEDVKAFHREYYGPAQMTLVAVGDLDPSTLQSQVKAAFTGWSGGKPRPEFARVKQTDAVQQQTVFLAEKTNVSVVWGQATKLQYRDPDTLALRAATSILGSGFTGRLMATVRDQEGLTYGIGAGVTRDTFSDGDFRIVANFSPALLDRGIASTKRELTLWYEQGVTAEELERTKQDLVGSYKVGLATTDGLAGAIIATVHRGHDIRWLDEYPRAIEALTLEKVNGAIKKHLNPSSMVLIKAGTVPER